MTKHFFVVGAQRSGTTYLYHLLDSHPEIIMARPIQPEPKFFLYDRLYERGLDYYYQTFFPNADTRCTLGEKSTSYIESEKVAQRIMSTFPDAKIVMVLRDPVKRAISNYWFSVNNGLETLPLAEAIYQEDARREQYDHERISASPYAYMQRGRYMDYINLYEKYVPTNQLKVVIYEPLLKNPETLQDFLAFLGVSTDYTPPDKSAKNASEKLTTEVPDDLRRYMQNYFADSNARLAAYLNVDLGQWW